MSDFDATVLYGQEYRHAPEPVWERMRHDHPLVHDTTGDRGPVWWLTRYDDVAAVFADHETYSAATYEDRTGVVLGPTLISRDDHGHVLRRSIVAPDLVGKRLATFFDLITHCATALIDQFAHNGAADLVAQFSKRLPVDVISAMLGMSGDGDLFRQWVTDMILALAPVAELRAKGKAAHASFCSHIAPALQQVDDPERTDLIAKIARAEVEGFRLDHEEIVAFCGLLFIAGGETTDKAIGNLWWNLLTRPELFAEVRADRELWHAAFSETMRRTPPVISEDRFTTRTVEWHGVEIPPGSMIRVCLASAHLDETKFADPLTFDLHRGDLHLEKELRSGGSTQPGRNGHLGFGLGKHFCLGYELARQEAVIGSQLLLDRLGEIQLVGQPPGPRLDGRSFQSVPGVNVTFSGG
jgi:cytochrome P450